MEAPDDLMPHIQGDASTTGALDAVNEKGVGTPARF